MDDQLRPTVLVVDDTKENIDILVKALEDEYDVASATDGNSVLECIKSINPDLILLDINLPGIDGYEVCSTLKGDSRTVDIPVIFLTGMYGIANKTKGFELGAVDYITKPFEILEVKARVKTHLTLKNMKVFLEGQKEILEKKVQERTRELALTQEATIQSLASLAETRDNETGGHIRRTQYYVKILAEYLKGHRRFRGVLGERTIDLLFKSAALHDIGKVGVPDKILLKPGKLTCREFEEMKKHTTLGYESLMEAERHLGNNSFLRNAREIAFSHHEKWDGTGYPQGLKGEKIPFSGRLMAVADVYDALISKRVYKSPFPHSKSVKIIAGEKGKQFDPDITDAFLSLESKFRKIALLYADFEEERAVLTE